MMASMRCTLLALLVLLLCTYATFGTARHRNVEEHASTNALPGLTPFDQQPVGSALPCSPYIRGSCSPQLEIGL